MKIALLLWLALPLAGEQLFYSKSFPGSSPAYTEIRIDEAGHGEYREDPKDDNPLTFQLTENERVAAFAIAAKLDYFKRQLESPAKVAKMGMKTFRYEKGGESHEVKFNYSEDLDARALLDFFERVAETEQNRIELERTVKYDKLGVENALLRVEIAWDKKRLVAPEQLLPLLDRVIKNESYMHMARNRASAIAEAIRAAK